MASRRLPRRVAMFAAAFGITAIAGTAPAFAAAAGENIFGSGSSLQKVAQNSIWIPKWEATPGDHSTLSNNPTVTYFSSSSGHGLDEFGNNTGALDLTQDTNADSAATNGYGVPVLDAYVGTDDPPGGPVSTPGSQLADASQAATGGAATAIDEITVPVAQAPVAVLLSIPTGITIGSGTKINLTNSLLQHIWSNNVPAAGGYGNFTWGALLSGAGLTKVAASPGVDQFTDNGGATGGSQRFTLQVRSSASGTSYTFKGFLNISGDAKYPSSFVTDDDKWPVTTRNTGNTGGSQLVADTTAQPGSVGYANLADAATASPGYTNEVQTVTNGGSHQILYAQVQSNEGGSPVQFASPQGSTVGSANVYIGNNIDINGATPTRVGHWTVPLSGSTFVPTGTWGGTLADDPDVYDHDVTGGVKTDFYPIVAATYDLGWTSYTDAGSNVVGDFGGTVAKARAAGTTARSYLYYLTKQGQTDLSTARLYYAPLPQKIDTYAVAAALKVLP